MLNETITSWYLPFLPDPYSKIISVAPLNLSVTSTISSTDSPHMSK